PSPTWLLSHFFFRDTQTPLPCPLSLHDALPISSAHGPPRQRGRRRDRRLSRDAGARAGHAAAGIRGGPALRPGPRDRRALGLRRSEEHTSELQSRENLVCRLLLEKKKRRRQNSR